MFMCNVKVAPHGGKPTESYHPTALQNFTCFSFTAHNFTVHSHGSYRPQFQPQQAAVYVTSLYSTSPKANDKQTKLADEYSEALSS